MSDSPKITVLMSVYNGEKFLSEAIESILNQSFSDFEFIIIDDKSTDSSLEIIKSFADLDCRIIIIQNKENIGLTKSLNHGLKFAKGDYIARMDADDVSMVDRLSVQFKEFLSNQNVLVVSGNIDYINSAGEELFKTKRYTNPCMIAWGLFFGNCLGGHSQVMFKLKPVIELGGYSEKFKYAQDYELWGRMLNIGMISIIPDVILQYRSHKDSISIKNKTEQETYAHLISQKIMKTVSNCDFTLEGVIDLKHFWQLEFSNTILPNAINRKVQKLYTAFKKKNQNVFKGSEYAEIRKQLSQRFFQWARYYKSQSDYFSMVLALIYFLIWLV
jgi:glycosyltransferase involved in cell wall biosynthesis